MKVHATRGSYEKRDAFYAMAPLNYCLRICGLNCIYRDGSKLKQSWSLTRNIFLILIFGIANAISLYNKVCLFGAGIVSYGFKDTVQFLTLFGYFQYLFDLTYVYRRGRYNCLEYYKIYDYIDKALSMTYYNENRKCNIYLILFFTTVNTTISVLELTVLYTTYGLMVMIIYGIDYMNVVLRNLSMADTIAQVIQIEFRLKLIGDVLEEFCVTTDNLPDAIKDVAADRSYKKSFRNVQVIDQQHLKIRKLCECYLLLLEQCDYINKTYGLRILGMCLIILIDMIVYLNYAIRILVGSLNFPYNSRASLIATSIVWVGACTLLLLYEMYRCEECYRQTERITRFLDYLLINKKICLETRSSLENLRSLTSSRPVQFHAVHFYKLDYALLLSVASVVVTYTIILLQNMN